ncbi:MAG: undecaprenyl-diphosphate phosphatase [Betaproteobacteria bacterium]|nr:undecaprenyl-diphosphate phosphatase [Betaproteobacteria bacterium]
MNTLHLYLLAIMQGVTELFPVSSLGHSVLVPALLQWPINRDAFWFLPFVVVLHLGTASAMLLYFWRDWARIIGATVRSRGSLADPQARLLWLLVAGSIPAGLLGLMFEHALKRLFGGFMIVAVFLILNGVMLIWGDRLKKRAAQHGLERLSFRRALAIGLAQSMALIPGMSRSGATVVAGLSVGLDYEAAARFSFLLATPIIGAAGILEVPKLLFHHAAAGHAAPLGTILAAGGLAGVFAFLSTWFLMHYFKDHEVAALRPFGLYCVLAGVGATVLHFVA